MSQPTDPISVQRLLDEAVRLTRSNFRRVIPAVALPMALAGGVAAALQLPVNYARASRSFGGWETALYIASFVLSLGALMLGSGAVAAAAVDAAAGRPTDMRRAWLTFLRPRVIFTGLLAFLGVGLGTMCCVLPGLYIALLWCISMPVMLEEQRFGISALERSGELMRHNPSGAIGNDPRFRAFVVLFAGFLLAYSVAFIVQLPLGVAVAVGMAREMAKGEHADPQAMMLPMLWLQIPSSMLSMALHACTQFFSTIGVSVLYFDVRRRREGFDLEQAAEQLGSIGAGQ